MGGAVLTYVKGVVGKDKESPQLHQRRQTNRRAHVITEDQESPAVGDESPIQRHAVDHRPHGVLAHSEVDIPSGEGIGVRSSPGTDDAVLLQDGGCGGAREVRRAAHHIGNDFV